jgi:hypothetical protein
LESFRTYSSALQFAFSELRLPELSCRLLLGGSNFVEIPFLFGRSCLISGRQPSSNRGMSPSSLLFLVGSPRVIGECLLPVLFKHFHFPSFSCALLLLLSRGFVCATTISLVISILYVAFYCHKKMSVLLFAFLGSPFGSNSCGDIYFRYFLSIFHHINF